MPALITHHLFGERSSALLPDGIIDSQEELLAFLLGNQGPDPFFFRATTTPTNIRACHEMAHRMHNELMTRAFAALRDGVSHLACDDERVGRAFALGMLSHYTLDRTAHPFVYAEQYATIEAGGAELEGAGNEVHAIIEGDLDSWMLWRERHVTVAEQPPYRELVRTDRIDRVAGALLSHVAWAVFGIELGADQYAGATHDMELLYRTIEPAGSTRQTVIGTVERLARDHSLISSLAHRVTESDDCACANLDHHVWTHPFTGEACSDSFLDRFNEALTSWNELSSAFVRDEGLEQAIGRLNYSGRPLGDDERWSAEE